MGWVAFIPGWRGGAIEQEGIPSILNMEIHLIKTAHLII